ncbi:unnamed protein product [Rhizophagus irregularis]|nr:unnamed protein product [Rhizophagus irregularis]CAB4441460.1 unnamed protein product [Rhizophagus irregularis]
MFSWKYSKERLMKNKYCAHIIHAKKVVCICGKIIKLNRRWEEDYLERHARRLGCKASEGQRTIYSFFKPSETEIIESSDDDWDSDVYDNLDEEEILRVDEVEENDLSPTFTTIYEESQGKKVPKKRKVCNGLQSEQISQYIQRTPAQFGGSRRVEIIALELFPNLFSQKFSRKKLNYAQKRKLNRTLYAESIWQIDRGSNSIRAKTCTGIAGNTNVCVECNYIRTNKNLCNKIAKQLPPRENMKFTPKHLWEDNPLKKLLQNIDLREIWNILNNENADNKANSWIILADKAINGAFKEMPVFAGLCKVMSNVVERKMKNKGKQNLKYPEEFTSFLVILGGISTRALDLFRQNLEGLTIQSIRNLRRNNEDCLSNPDLCYENAARFKRLIDAINYDGPVVAMTDNTKLKPCLRYSSTLGCIVGSVLSNEDTKVNVYNDIPNIINQIKNQNAIAKDVRAYVLQVPLPKFPPVVIALIPNTGSDTADRIAALHKKVIKEFSTRLGLHILSLGSDGAIVEFQAQQKILGERTPERLVIHEENLNIKFTCPIFENVGPVIRVQDPKHAKKTARNAAMSGARWLTFGTTSIQYSNFLTLIKRYNSIMYKSDVIKVDRQDDAAAYRTFCSSNLKQCLTSNYEIEPGMEGFFIYIFVIGEMIDSYLNRLITPIERIRMVMMGYFFLQIWRFHVETLSRKYPDFISVKRNFLANQSFCIFTSLAESMVLLIKAHREFYPQVPLLPWFHGSESCEHFFGVARQINSDFDFSELIQMLPKISQYSKALRTQKLTFEKEKNVRQGYHFDYNSGQLDETSLEILRAWPSDNEILQSMHHAHYLACELAGVVGMLQPEDLLINTYCPQVEIIREDPDVSVSNVNSKELDSENQILENENVDLSTALSEASFEINRLNQKEDKTEFDLENEFHDRRSQVQMLNEVDEQALMINCSDKAEIDFILNNKMDFELMYNQRKKHEAYCSKPLERKFKTAALSANSNAPNLIHPNKASHFVAYFTKNNDPQQRFVTQREKRWKTNRNNAAMTLANLHLQELQKSKKKATSNRKKSTEALIQIPNIETANISKDFPLVIGDYVFVLYGNQMCVGRVEAIYFEVSPNHCYTDEAITTIDDISYLSIHIFVPIHLDLFSDMIREECLLLTHHVPSNVYYHISKEGVSIENNILKLLGKEKDYYFNYFGRSDVIEKI